MNKLKAGFQEYWKPALFILCVIEVLCICIHHQQLKADIQDKEHSIVVMQEEYATNLNALQNELDMSKENAEILQNEIYKAQNAVKQPVCVYTESSDDIDKVIKVTEDRVSKNDSTLPPAALKPTDKTVITSQPNNPEIPVGIYKINTYRNWEVGVGVGVHEGDFYVPVSLQRNYSKSHSIEAELHLHPKDKNINGYELKYNIHF